ncbi:MAG: hypothetical protein ACRD7E_00010 [Bryobacteraceae bacterium]
MAETATKADTIPRAYIRTLRAEDGLVRCLTSDAEFLLPRVAANYLRPGDRICVGSPASPVHEFLAIQNANRQKPRQVYFCPIGYVTQPKTDKRDQHYLRAEVLDGTLGIRSLHIPCTAVRDYFYFFASAPGEDRRTTLYELLRAPSIASFTDLRLCYCIRRLELATQADAVGLRFIERAFNLLAHPELRSCHDALLRDPDAPTLFPYGGFGQCVVAGDLAEDGETFFVRRILSYLPQQVQRQFRAPCRRIEFFDGYAVYRDSRRRAEVYLDPGVLPLGWEPTWNRWKHLVGTKLGVSGTFVETGKYRHRGGEWHLVRWQTALPSRLALKVPSNAAEAMKDARRAYERFGEHYDAIERIRLRLEYEPLDERALSDLCHQLRIPADFNVSQFCWKADYDPFFYEQLKKRSVNVFLFRNEYIFQLARTVVAEIPQQGHATYVFAKPTDIREFVRRYAQTTRDKIRRNRGNIASELGYIGRVMHGKDPRRWLRELRQRIGEAVDYSLV